MECKKCHSQANNQVLTPEGPHYGKVVCASCGNFLTWLPRPVTPVNPAKLPWHPEGDPLPVLKGQSARQIEFGERCRTEMTTKLQASLSVEMYAAMLTIADATFWIANKDRGAKEIRWPKEWS